MMKQRLKYVNEVLAFDVRRPYHVLNMLQFDIRKTKKIDVRPYKVTVGC